MRAPRFRGLLPGLAVLLALTIACSGGAAGPTPATGGSGDSSSGEDPWEAARERGVDFRAVGQEPGWWLEISGRDLELAVDYGERRLTLREPKRELEGGRRVYRGTADGHAVEVGLEKRRCEDAMSGEAFTTTVTVELDGETYRGCGRTLR
jgi:putative lipoprotein